MKKLLKKNSTILVIIVWLIPFLGAIYLWSENWQRALTLLFLLVAWIVGFFKSKDSLKFSLLFLLAVSTLNITFSFSQLDSCFKHSVFVNYLCPTFHIIDIFGILTLLVSVANIQYEKISKVVMLSLPLITYFFVHLILHPNINSAITITRLVVIIFVFTLSIEKIQDILKSGKQLFPYIFLPLIVQLILASLQVYLRRDLNLQYIGESNLMAGTINSSFISFSTGEILRGYGTFPHPNVLAGYGLALSLVALRVYRKRDWNLWVVLLISGLTIALTFSRIHMLLFLASISIVIIFQMKNHLFSFFPFLIERFQTLTFGSSSVKERIALLNESYNVVRNNWLVGVGSGEFVRYISNDIRTVSNISLFQPVHNIFLLSLAEHGILGSLTLLPYLLYTLVKSKKGTVFVSISVLCILGIGMFDHYLLSIPQGLIILMLFLI